MQPFVYTRITIFHLFNWLGLIIGGNVGGTLGWKYFGITGAVIGGLLGLYLGGVIGLLPERLAMRAFFKDLENSSTERLWEIVAEPEWNFRQSMALLQLAGRGEDVFAKLEQILTMLESGEPLERVYAWDALRLVFPDEANKLEGYNPQESSVDCYNKIQAFRSAQN